MRKSLPLLLAVLLITSIAGAGLAADTQNAAATPSTLGVVNINTADMAQLQLLPRVGVKAAQRIVDYRTAHGPFQKATDIMQVKGFGNKTFERLSAYIVVDGKTTLSQKIKSPRKPRAPKAS
ncbi:MAG TPA: ComEA family DNA-binding protein [Thermoanaerobaculia bacterium]|nr:ComEA family DNA-binding protein [Thermoanaerobaculia bacterium]